MALIKSTGTPPTLNHNRFYPAWDRTTALRTFSFEGREYTVTIDGDKRVAYGEGLLTGYRHYDTKGVKPAFAFGFGKSYTDFRFSALKVKNESSKGRPRYIVSFDVTNTGSINGKEVAQIYVRPVDAKVFRPYKELKGFEKKIIRAGETVRFEIELTDEAFAYYKTSIHDFGYDPGKFEILVGNASDNILLRKTVSVK